MSRNENIKVLDQTFDVVIIGGGITGAGIFLRCCEKGLKTLLVDAGDFAGGTSSRSAKMIHGGLRYLQYLQVKLVREALQEREYLLTHYSHLVKPLPFFMPVYGSRFGLAKMKVGLTGYDAMASSSILPKHKLKTFNEVKRAYPMLKEKGLKGGFYYYDAMTNDARLTNEVIMDGVSLGGVAINYLKMEGVARVGEGINSIQLVDQLTDLKYSITSNYIIAATGVWTDETLGMVGSQKGKVMLPSKGIHIVVDGSRFHPEDVLLMPCEDKRFIWICPWLDGLAIIGATDTVFEGDLREPGTTQEDIDYILQNVNQHLSTFQLTEEDVLSVFSGLRPLLDDTSEGDSVKVSRDYNVWWEQENLLMIAGGKLTSFLSMADNVVSKLADRLDFDENKSKKSRMGLWYDGPPTIEGSEHQKISECDEDEEVLLQELPHKVGHVKYFIRHQHAVKISDVLTRRLALTYRMKDLDDELVAKVANVMAAELNWDAAKRAERMKDYTLHWQGMHQWVTV